MAVCHSRKLPDRRATFCCDQPLLAKGCHTNHAADILISQHPGVANSSALPFVFTENVHNPEYNERNGEKCS